MTVDFDNLFCREIRIMAENVQKMEFEEDPERCQGKCATGQCPNKGIVLPSGVRGSFCAVHGGASTVSAEQKQSYRNYQLTKFKARQERHATSPQIKNLRDEVGILRMMMEERLNKCRDDADLILQSGAISDLALKIEKVVGSCHKLEGSMNQLLDKQAILQFASEMISVISEEIKDSVVLDRITNKLMVIMGRLGEENLNESL